FADHRETRSRVRAEARGAMFLNLFAYTGSFTCAAAAGAAVGTTSVDASQTYLDWARDDLRLNRLSGELVRSGVDEFLRDAGTRRRAPARSLDGNNGSETLLPVAGGFSGPLRSLQTPGVRRSIAPWAALAGLVALTLATAAFIFVSVGMRDRGRFARAIRAAVDRIEARLSMYESMLRGCAGLLAARPDLTPEEFHAYARRLEIEQWYPGVQGVGFAPRFRKEETAAIEAGLRARGFPGLRVWPDSPGEERTAIVMLEPQDRRNRAAMGYDMFTEPVRREAMERARDEANAAISGKVTLIQEIDPLRQAGFLMYVPVYRGGDVPPTLEARRQSLIGWAYSPFRADDLFQAVFGSEAEPLLEFRVY